LVSLLSNRNPITIPTLDGLSSLHRERETTLETRIGADSTVLLFAVAVATISIEQITVIALLRGKRKAISANGGTSHKRSIASQSDGDGGKLGNRVTSRARANALSDGNNLSGGFRAFSNGTASVGLTFVQVLARLSGGVGASVARLDGAGGAASVSVVFVTVVAGFGTDLQAITANGKAKNANSDARETRFDSASGGTTVTRLNVSIVALFLSGLLLVSANFGTRLSGRGARITIFDLARGRATVSVIFISVVALFLSEDDAVAANGSARAAGASEAGFGDALGRAAVSVDFTTVGTGNGTEGLDFLAPCRARIGVAASRRGRNDGTSARAAGQLFDETAQLVPISVGKDARSIATGSNEKLGAIVSGTGGNSVNDKSGYELLRIVDGGLEIGGELSSRSSGTSLDFTRGIQKVRTIRFEGDNFTVGTIGEEDQNLGSALSGLSLAGLAGKHLCTVNDTSRNGGSRTAAGSRGIENMTLSIASASKLSCSILGGSQSSSVLQVHRTVPREGVEVGDTQVGVEGTISKSSNEIGNEILFDDEKSGIDGRRSIENQDNIRRSTTFASRRRIPSGISERGISTSSELEGSSVIISCGSREASSVKSDLLVTGVATGRLVGTVRVKSDESGILQERRLRSCKGSDGTRARSCFQKYKLRLGVGISSVGVVRVDLAHTAGVGKVVFVADPIEA